MTTRHLRLVSDADDLDARTAAIVAETTVMDSRRATLAVACPHCKSQPGVGCRTPNGWGTVHQARIRAGQGQPVPAPVRRARRLSEAQAERIERAAEYGHYLAPGQHAYFRGDAAERACANALEQRGLIRLVRTNDDGDRVFELTVDGWRAYHTDPKVIRRLPNDRHPAICPCRTDAEGATR